jgi:IS5 family transposase
MRQNRQSQLPLASQVPNHPKAREYAVISRILDRNHTIYSLVTKDLTAGKRSNTGRKGMTAEQVVRCGIVKTLEGLDYRDLAFHLEDSGVAQEFSRVPFGKAVSFQALQQNIKRVRETTWAEINGLLVQYAKDEGIEDGRKVRTDCTVVENYTHYPTDSRLLWDGVRKLTELMRKAQELYCEASFDLRDHRRAAKRRALEIVNARDAKKRRKAYRKLIEVSEQTVGYSQEAIAALRQVRCTDILRRLGAEGLAAEIEDIMVGALGVINQTYRRVINGEKVPAQEKIVSLFEPHTDIIVKDRREALYGHKVCLTAGVSCLITDCVVLEGNPADSSLVNESLERHKALFGRYPRQVAYDGGFASIANLRAAKEKEGVKDVAFAKKRGLDPLEMAQSLWVYRKLRNFRAGVEGCISALKRICRAGVCTWKGHEGFKRFVHCAVVAFNLLIIARHMIR